MASLTLYLTLRIETLEASMAKMSSILHDYDRHEFIYMPNVNVHDPCFNYESRPHLIYVMHWMALYTLYGYAQL